MQKLSRVANNIRTDVAVSKPIAPSTLGISLFHIMRRFPFASNMSFPFLWNQLSFRARPCDYWALEEVLLNREYEFLSPILLSMRQV